MSLRLRDGKNAQKSEVLVKVPKETGKGRPVMRV
jgi:hypothetical protein